MLMFDLMISEPNIQHVICTNFGATLDLGDLEKGNCFVGNHSMMPIFFVVSNWQAVEFKNIQGK